MAKFIVYSPDRIPIAPQTYTSRQAAESALAEWCQRFEEQGYYAGIVDIIPLHRLPGECSIEIVPERVTRCFTFGSTHVFPLGSFITITADTHTECRAVMVKLFGVRWAFDYTPEQIEEQRAKGIRLTETAIIHVGIRG